MSVYDPLRAYLHKQRLAELMLTFAEIEKTLDRDLPKSAERPQWWANQKDGVRPQRDAWQNAGYDAFLIKGSGKVRFVKH
jgi:hypothetical protein